MAATYSVVAVQRTPAQLVPPTLTVLGPLQATVEWTDVLNRGSDGTFKMDVEGVQSDIKEALRDLTAQPLEVWVYRDSTMVFAGPVMGGEVTGTTLSLSCLGLEHYLRYMMQTSDDTYSSVDQHLIAQALVDDWQALDYGDYGIDTSGITTSSTPRTQFIPGALEPRKVYDLVREFGALDGGYDFYCEPESRDLVLGIRGSDLSSTVFLERGVQSTDIRFAVSPGIIASEIFATGTNSGLFTALSTTKSNTSLRQSFGRSGAALQADGADTASLLSDAAQAALDGRQAAIFVPGPGVIPVAGAGVEDFNTGDTITYTFDAGLGLHTGSFRVRSKKVTVNEAGQESISVDFT